MTMYNVIIQREPIHLLPEVECNSYIIVYSKFSTGNYSVAVKRGHWSASEDIYIVILLYLSYLTLT